ncbi:L-serine ammonia-lyase, iron-sulfur-dependent, subunit alpha [Roseivirga sp. E12]|uniref:L-serine ammonia-lyase, iron-sulfur-dependent, subunit alpha n=1 Tax=Roseivirga sp. E12 TaxID=2819237 RepID=UPI001ABC514F|nr:L-serine ammonia-lyase, iron-sulfur-dependent, subunit alpha [Roseivirga sp. E12]MBO3697657.1 L-serine ammonia-lyase, iron-sulfur-dependent, subunit alpha [Roseivirga sp. E12]
MSAASIFNDVIGPVMRGPSSSHSAAACRMGLLIRDLMQHDISSLSVDYDPNGSLVTTHKSQGTDMGLYGGLMGWEADDPRMVDYESHLSNSGITVHVNYLSYGATHPNQYRINVTNQDFTHSITAISTGGGMMEITEVDGVQLSICGDYYELLMYVKGGVESFDLPELSHEVQVTRNGAFIHLRSSQSFPNDLIKALSSKEEVLKSVVLSPVLPVHSRKDLTVPFNTCSKMMEIGSRENLSIWELAIKYEAARGGISEPEVLQKMTHIQGIMRKGIETGLKGKEFDDRILPVQSVGFRDKMLDKQLLDAGMLNRVILYTTAMMEVKSSMEVFVAAPTAGSCGALPGAILGVADHMNASEDLVNKALMAAGIIGLFIAEHATFAAEVAGCQAETGAGGAMAAAGLVVLMNGSLEQATSAASLALQNSLGIICDPIGNRVEAPCLGKNIMAASNALSCANMALANYEHLIPFDEVVQSMKEVGDMMAHELTCTGLGGLAATPTGQAIKNKLEQKAIYC